MAKGLARPAGEPRHPRHRWGRRQLQIVGTVGGVIGPGMTFLNSAVAVRGSAIYQHSFSACLGVIDGIAVVGCWVTRVTPVS